MGVVGLLGAASAAVLLLCVSPARADNAAPDGRPFLAFAGSGLLARRRLPLRRPALVARRFCGRWLHRHYVADALHLLRRAGLHAKTSACGGRLHLPFRRAAHRCRRQAPLRFGIARMARDQGRHQHCRLRRTDRPGLSAFALRSGQPAPRLLFGRAARRRRLVSADADQHGRAQRHDRLHRRHRNAARRRRLAILRAVFCRARGAGAVVHRLSAMAARRAHHRLSDQWYRLVGGSRVNC